MSVSKEEDLSVSISKSMTIDKLKNELTKNKIVYSAAKKKADFVSLYISNGLHQGLKEDESEAKEASLQKEESNKNKALPETIAKITVLEELIMSMTIMGHGCEDITTPWTKDRPISQYFRNNVRVYSRSCVPDVNAIGNIFKNEDTIRDVQRRFSNVPKGETSAIIDAYAKDVKFDYIRQVTGIITNNDEMVDTPGFQKLSALENLSKTSSLSTYLANKHFSFYKDDPKQKLTQAYQHLYKTLGLQVTDIRLRRTAMDGSVSYEQLFSPGNLISERTDIANFNLIYRDGLTYVLKEILNRKELVKPALAIFGFKGRQERIMDLSLEQIYEFFQLIGVKYANLMDYTCRACSIGRIPQALSNRIYDVEQKYSVKPVAFGKLSKGKHSSTRKSKRSKGMRITKKREK